VIAVGHEWIQAKMEALSKAQKEAIQKMGQSRLITKLRGAGISEEEVDAMDRAAMITAWAECVAAGKDKPAPGQPTPGYDVDLERRKLELEIRRFEAQEKARAEELLAQEKLRREENDRADKIRNEEFANAQRLKKMELESQEKMKDAELKLLSKKQEDKVEERESAVNRAKRYGDAIKTSLFNMGQDVMEMPSFFRHVEAVYTRYTVPDDLQASLLQPYLNAKSRSIVGRMDPLLSQDYVKVRDLILKEHKLTPATYLEYFNSTVFAEDETCVMFAARLRALFDQYVDSRGVKKDFESLVSLIICDRIKSTLSDGTLRHILSIEASNKDGWLRANELADAVDVYTANHFSNDKPRASAVGSYSLRNSQGGNQQVGNPYTKPPPARPYTGQASGGGPPRANITTTNTGAGGPTTVRKGPKCFNCDQWGHKKVDCPRIKAVNQSNRRSFACSASPLVAGPPGGTPSAVPSAPPPSAQVNKCAQPVAAPAVNCDNETVCKQRVDTVSASYKCTTVGSDHSIENKGNIVHNTFQSEFVRDYESYRDFASLQFVDVCINEPNINTVITALEDSGTELCVVKSAIVESVKLPHVGIVRLRGIIGDPVEANLVKLHISLASNSQLSIPIVCAVCPDLNENMILTVPVVKQLKCLSNSMDGLPVIQCDNAVVGGAEDVVGAESQLQPAVQTEGGGDINPQSDRRVADADVLRSEQLSDDTLKPCWAMAEQAKGGFFIRGGLLYHEEKVESIGEKCVQLVLPACRRQCVLELAHSTNHESYRRTRDRIRLSFFWPCLLKAAKQYCRECESCQKMARITVWDRVPISAVPRAQYAFQVFYADCAGPLFPNQKTNAYNYFFAMCDSATSFPFAYPLRTLTAKNICDAMLKTFSITGIPEVVILDNASYNRSAVLRETMKKLNCSVRFSTPYHPQGHAAAERLIGSLKQMIAKVAADKPKQWHLHLDYILWALRESKNESLGVAPWTLVFSRLPRGPLSVLKESWEGARDVPFSVGKNADAYLRDLQSRLETVKQFAESHNASAQQKYTCRYNMRARDKQFAVGDQVLLLTPESTASRTFSRWRGPAVVVEVCSSHSYVVELDGVRHHVHANRLKQFFVSVSSVAFCPDFDTINNCVVDGCSVISDLDEDFGDINTFHTAGNAAGAEKLPSQRIDKAQLTHLSPSQQRELLSLLDDYPECFSDDPGLCTLAVHEINLTADFRPKRLRAYRVPEKLKPQVSIEIQRMLDLGIIRPSTSEMVSPLVVVLKGKDGKDGIRLAVDYSYINKFTQNDPYPVPEIDSVIQRVGGASHISTFDASAGYHQTKVREGDEPLTAFVCDDGIFEFTRTPFGGKACGSTFLRAIRLALKPVQAFTDAYVDDMIVHTHKHGFTQHLHDIRNFLERIKEVHLTLKLRKCRFAQHEVKFCGKIIGSGNKRPDPAKVAAVQGLKPAKTKTEVRQLLGFFSYFRDHIPNFAVIARPMTDLTAKSVPNSVPWTAVHSAALDQLKQALCQATTNPLHIADFQLPFNVTVDASDYGVAGYLSQIHGEGIERPLAFFSVKLNASQKAWATVHKEAFAVITALRKFRHWIFGAEVNVYSDHNPLTFLTESAPKNAKLMRWSLALQEFNIKFHYLRGKLNTAADCLSRLGPDEP
jgi:hypothetical protein